MNIKAKLVLEDGSVFEGHPAGFPKSTAGEVVFATGMVGYDQSITDPSYAGQILTFTYPLIGNWGMPPRQFWESEKIQVQGLVLSELTTKPNHWQMQKTLNDWLITEKIPAIVGIDTRALTQKLREKGVMLGKIVLRDEDVDFWDPNRTNLVAKVSVSKPRVYFPNPKSEYRNPKQYQNLNSQNSKRFENSDLENPLFAKQNSRSKHLFRASKFDFRNSPNIALLNCGAKANITRSLLARGTTVWELPWNYDPFENNLPIDGLVISNGPGNPKMADKSIAIIKTALKKKIPTFGICLGNQLLALAAGGNTYKLKFGHRAQNQPTIEVNTKRCYITTQNHGFAVDDNKLPDGFTRWFYNANDNTNEGIIHQKLPFFSVQFHPEACPGPIDTEFLFDFFMEQFK